MKYFLQGNNNLKDAMLSSIVKKKYQLVAEIYLACYWLKKNYDRVLAERNGMIFTEIQVNAHVYIDTTTKEVNLFLTCFGPDIASKNVIEKENSEINLLLPE